MFEMTPRQIVAELDKYIVGQQEAKRAVAVAIRNRWRRQLVAPEMRKEIGPKNMMMIGPTGVGKTEIARRLASLTGAPFVKVEATKYTEVGYYGRDVESMIRDLVENAVGIVRADERKKIEEQAKIATENHLVDLIAQTFRKQAASSNAAPSQTTKSSESTRSSADSNPSPTDRANPLFPSSLDGVRAIKIDTNAPFAGIVEFVQQVEKVLNRNVSGDSTETAPKRDGDASATDDASANNGVSSTDDVSVAGDVSVAESSNEPSDAEYIEGEIVGRSSMGSVSDSNRNAATAADSISNAATADEKVENPPNAQSPNGKDSQASEPSRVDLDEIRTQLQSGYLENVVVQIVYEQKTSPFVIGGIGMESMENDFQNMFENILPKRNSKRELSVAEARKIIFEQECERLVDKEKINAQAVELAESLGVIFIDEIDKIVSSEQQHGADVSRQGVQRDLLPIVEGTTVQTKYGFVSTDHILFIAAGAFHRSKPSDLTPELQGRFPIRVELSDLSRDDFIRILTEPRGALTKQYAALMKTEGVELVFDDDAIAAIAQYAFDVNQTSQNIGARRLYTIMERLLEELSFEAPEMKMGRVVVNAAYVETRLEEVSRDEGLSKFIL